MHYMGLLRLPISCYWRAPMTCHEARGSPTEAVEAETASGWRKKLSQGFVIVNYICNRCQCVKRQNNVECKFHVLAFSLIWQQTSAPFVKDKKAQFVSMGKVSSSVTIWLEYFFFIWPYTSNENLPNSISIAKVGCNFCNVLINHKLIDKSF